MNDLKHFQIITHSPTSDSVGQAWYSAILIEIGRQIKKRMCLGTFSRRGAVASATIYSCAECASLRSIYYFIGRNFL